MPEVAFLPGWLYQDPAIAQWERDGYAKQWWHPLAAVSQLQPGQAVALPLLGESLLLTRELNGVCLLYTSPSPRDRG